MTPLSLLLLPSNAAAALLPASRVAGGATSAAFANGFGTTCATDELRRPPRGWNSYDSSPPWGPPPLGMEASREGPTLKNAATLSRTLLPHGYDMFTLDSGWFGEDNLYGTQTIDEYGRLVPNVTQFPSAANGAGFRPVADKIHQHVRCCAAQARSLDHNQVFCCGSCCLVLHAYGRDSSSESGSGVAFREWLWKPEALSKALHILPQTSRLWMALRIATDMRLAAWIAHGINGSSMASTIRTLALLHTSIRSPSSTPTAGSSTCSKLTASSATIGFVAKNLFLRSSRLYRQKEDLF
eukprot:SAG31_NODE_35_length_31836_cov_10.841352_28_plen_297_part_00